MLYLYEGCCGDSATERRCRLAEYEADPTFACPRCGRQLKQRITAPRYLNKTGEFKAFKSPVDGTIITSETGLREHNRRNNVVNVHDGYDEKAYLGMVNRDLHAAGEAERRKDARADAVKAVEMVEQGYVPEVAPDEDL